jgi:hypothetical protein
MAADPLAAALKRIARDLRDRRRDFALVGGLAVSLRAEERLTKDVDLAVSVKDDAQAEEVVQDLLEAGYSLKTALEQKRTGRLATVRLLPPRSLPGKPLVDLLFASCGMEPEVVEAAEIFEVLPGSRVKVATPIGWRPGAAKPEVPPHLGSVKMVRRSPFMAAQEIQVVAAPRGFLDRPEFQPRSSVGDRSLWLPLDPLYAPRVLAPLGEEAAAGAGEAGAAGGREAAAEGAGDHPPVTPWAVAVADRPAVSLPGSSLLEPPRGRDLADLFRRSSTGTGSSPDRRRGRT